MDSKDKNRKMENNIREEYISKRFRDRLKTPNNQSAQVEWSEKEEWGGESAPKPNVRSTHNVMTPGMGSPSSSPGVGNMKVKLLQSDAGGGADDELVDPQDTLKAKCGQSKKCAELAEILSECNDRVNAKEKTRETCEQELFDFVECVADCVAQNLFKLLK
uniref:Ubiquinol-cytochrome C reductase hinge domain-containing protein n=1 Tax=Graphocephala atropunctata TaxID=36148 RepID=A0A1B6MRR2_9HEMI